MLNATTKFAFLLAITAAPASSGQHGNPEAEQLRLETDLEFMCNPPKTEDVTECHQMRSELVQIRRRVSLQTNISERALCSTRGPGGTLMRGKRPSCVLANNGASQPFDLEPPRHAQFRTRGATSVLCRYGRSAYFHPNGRIQSCTLDDTATNGIVDVFAKERLPLVQCERGRLISFDREGLLSSCVAAVRKQPVSTLPGGHPANEQGASCHTDPAYARSSIFCICHLNPRNSLCG